MAKSWSVNLEHGDQWWYAHVAELPGCFTRGTTREAALNALSEAVAEHLAFLRTHGLLLKKTPTDFSVSEEIHDIPELGESGGAVALFASDRVPVTGEDCDLFLRLMEWNRAELLALIEPIQEHERNARPLSGKRTVNETLRHIMHAEEWYVSRLGPAIQRQYEGRLRSLCQGRRGRIIGDQLVAARKSAVLTLKEVQQGGVPEVFQRRAYTGHPDEDWTFRKVLRRFVEHEREHIGTIKQLISLLATAPE
jgi:predicted RNase H-like HicB family nuclease/uncharacterized damage-inducible protein DinB